MNFCCACKEVLEEGEGELVSCTLTVPGQPEMRVAANVCYSCADDYEKYPAMIEALINARIIRVQYPELKFTPEQ
jgi:hypothetical protein